MNILIDDIEDLVEQEEGYLLGKIYIMHVPYHVVLLEIAEEDGVQVPAGPSEIVENMLVEIQCFDGATGKYMTFPYGERDYIAIITPYYD